MYRVRGLDDNIGPVLAQLTAMSHLELCSNADISGKFLHALKGPSELVTLDLGQCSNIKDAHLARLSRLTALSLLNLDGIRVRRPFSHKCTFCVRVPD